MRIICSWKTLFQKAHAVGKARLRHIANPTMETEQELSDLESDLKAYEELCLRADEMIHLPTV